MFTSKYLLSFNEINGEFVPKVNNKDSYSQRHEARGGFYPHRENSILQSKINSYTNSEFLQTGQDPTTPDLETPVYLIHCKTCNLQVTGLAATFAWI